MMTRLRHNTRGQLSTLDLIVSIILFITTIFMIIWANAETQRVIWNYENTQTYKEKAMTATDILLKTEGIPTNWDLISNLTADNITSLGFVTGANELDEGKFEAFKNLSYSETSRLMGFSKQDYIITIDNFNNTTLYTFGKDIDPVVFIERMAILGNTTVEFRLGLSPK
jgi:hypothetical protein